MYEISVVIPTYNREELIGNAIRSVLEQEGQGDVFEIAEILIIDDGSTDNTCEVIKALNEPKIVYHRFPQNRGPLEAWNKGIDMTRSEWIAFQDSDDIWHRDKLKKQVIFADKNREFALISHPFRAFFNDGSEIVTRVVESENMIRELAKSNFIGTPTMLVRKEALIDVGGFDRNISALQDWDFVIRLADKHKIGMIPDVLLDVNMTVEGMSKDASKYYESRCRIIAGNKDIFIKHGCFDDAVRSLLMHARNNDVLDTVGKMLELSLMHTN